MLRYILFLLFTLNFTPLLACLEGNEHRDPTPLYAKRLVSDADHIEFLKDTLNTAKNEVVITTYSISPSKLLKEGIGEAIIKTANRGVNLFIYYEKIDSCLKKESTALSEIEKCCVQFEQIKNHSKCLIKDKNLYSIGSYTSIGSYNWLSDSNNNSSNGSIVISGLLTYGLIGDIWQGINFYKNLQYTDIESMKINNMRYFLSDDVPDGAICSYYDGFSSSHDNVPDGAVCSWHDDFSSPYDDFSDDLVVCPRSGPTFLSDRDDCARDGATFLSDRDAFSTGEYRFSPGQVFYTLRTPEAHGAFLDEVLKGAKKRVILLSPFIRLEKLKETFTPSLLSNLQQRGVNIRLVTLLSPCNRFLGEETEIFSLLQKLYMNHSSFSYTTRNNFHAKTLIADDDLICEGSFNWLSAVTQIDHKANNFEMSVGLKGNIACNMVQAFQESDLGKSVLQTTPLKTTTTLSNKRSRIDFDEKAQSIEINKKPKTLP